MPVVALVATWESREHLFNNKNPPQRGSKTANMALGSLKDYVIGLFRTKSVENFAKRASRKTKNFRVLGTGLINLRYSFHTNRICCRIVLKVKLVEMRDG
ncbi:hypothetical protein Ancab_018959 [Ancistrocladus abbreviatus]